MKNVNENLFKMNIEEDEEKHDSEDEIIDLDEAIYNQTNFDTYKISPKQGTTDFNGMSKHEIINILMSSDQVPIKETKSIKRITDQNSSITSKNLKAARNLKDLNLKEDDPEIKDNDFNKAYSKVIKNMMNNNTNNKDDHPEIMMLLLSGDDNNEIIKKVSRILKKGHKSN